MVDSILLRRRIKCYCNHNFTIRNSTPAGRPAWEAGGAGPKNSVQVRALNRYIVQLTAARLVSIFKSGAPENNAVWRTMSTVSGGHLRGWPALRFAGAILLVVLATSFG